jgi:hypothetical protein
MVYYEYSAKGIVARGLLIDYDYAVKITKGTDHVVERRDLTARYFISYRLGD